ncbi:MAG: hypothetical protein ACI9WU_004141 [Myxococcota bacterium]|jgi:hypothetical protein
MLMRLSVVLPLVACLFFVGCGDDDDADAAAETNEAENADAPIPDTNTPPDEGAPDSRPEPIPLPDLLPRGLPATSALGQDGDLRPLRTIIHAHSIYSHDACDGEPVLKNGEPNEECLASFREALCTDHIDVMMLTEHTSRASQSHFEELFLHRAGDEWVEEDGIKVASVIICEDGHRAHIMPGLEGGSGEISPLGLTGHPVEPTGDDFSAVGAAYGDASPEGVAKLRAKNAVTTAIHLESQPKDWLATADLDALEIGNLHALVAPDLRALIGLDPDGPVVAFTEWLFAEDGRAPDLVFLEFHERLQAYMGWWDDLLQKRFITGFAGNDVHQNVLPLQMPDGDRVDSYRRMMKWYVNHLMVPELTPQAIRGAIKRGSLYMVFEIMGSPREFVFHAQSDDTVWRSGDTVPKSAREAGLRLVAPAPPAIIGEASVAPQVAMRLFRITADSSEVVADVEGGLDFTVTEPGRYRLEVFATPTHLANYLGDRGELVRELPWIYTNPIEVE